MVFSLSSRPVSSLLINHPIIMRRLTNHCVYTQSWLWRSNFYYFNQNFSHCKPKMTSLSYSSKLIHSIPSKSNIYPRVNLNHAIIESNHIIVDGCQCTGFFMLETLITWFLCSREQRKQLDPPVAAVSSSGDQTYGHAEQEMASAANGANDNSEIQNYAVFCFVCIFSSVTACLLVLVSLPGVCSFSF